MQSVSANGRLTQRVREGFFDENNVELFLYLGKNPVPIFARALKKATWCQTAYYCLRATAGECDKTVYFPINGLATGPNRMDYLMYVALTVRMPQIKLCNTRVPQYFRHYYGCLEKNQTCADFCTTYCDNQLHCYVSDGCSGLPNGHVYIGSPEALDKLGVHPEHRRCLATYYPRRKVSWGKNCIAALFDEISFDINGERFEPLCRTALYNALQHRMREDVFPIAGDYATSISCNERIALHENSDNRYEYLCCNEDERTRSFIVPFSFSTSAFADRGENGKFKSAFPVMMCCSSEVGVTACMIDDIRRLLVLQEEILDDYCNHRVRFVSTGDELGCNNGGKPSNSLTFSNGNSFWSVNPDQFSRYDCESDVWMSGCDLTFAYGNQDYCKQSDVCMRHLNIGHIGSRDCWRALTKPANCRIDGVTFDDICWDKWIQCEDLCPVVSAKAFGAICTDLERGQMRADFRTKKWLYERYTYIPGAGCCVPGSELQFDLCPVPGAFKYAYSYGRNVISELQGHFFNFTNDSDFFCHRDDYNCFSTYRFCGKNAICRVCTRIAGERDSDLTSGFIQTVDQAAFSQRCPREQVALIAPRYSDFINSIQPGGSINCQMINTVNVTLRTSTPGEISDRRRRDFGFCNTFGYEVGMIAVSWEIGLFESGIL